MRLPVFTAVLFLVALPAAAAVPLPRPVVPPGDRAVESLTARPPDGQIRTDDALRTWESGTYTYDGAGNITSIGPTINYTYDGWMRLATSAKTGSSSQTFSYDIYGNLTRIATVGALTRLPAVETASNQLDGPCPNEPNSVCLVGSYDVAGNQTGADGAFTYEFDELNTMRRLSGVARNEVYIYTADDERIATVRLFGTTADWQYTVRGADAKVLREFRTSPTGIEWKQDWIHAGGRQLASLRAVPGTATPTTRHFHLDHLGSTRLITDPTARRLAELRFEAFGEEAPDSQPFDERLKFTGHERDDAGVGDVRDLDYMHARFYSPFTGRFLAVDPVLDLKRAAREPQSWNRYSYVVNNPVNRVDPDGRVDQNWDGGAARQLFPGDRKAQLAWEDDLAIRTAKGTAWSVGLMAGGAGAFMFATNVAFRTSVLLNAMGIGIGITSGVSASGIAISKMSSDWAVKGFHMTVKGVEVSMHPGQGGSIVLKQVFSSTSRGDAKAAMKVVEAALKDPEVRKRFYREAMRAREYLQTGDSLARARSGEMNFLMKALERMGL